MTELQDAPRRFPFSAGVLLGAGLGGFFDGIVLHQLLQWHHMVSSFGYSPSNLENLRFNIRLDGVFHAATYVFVVSGLIMLWRAAGRMHPSWSARLLIGSVLVGFGLFNLVEGVINHHLLGLHHVNETVPSSQWIHWDLSFLIAGAVMVFGGWLLFRSGNRQSGMSHR